jgi:hypothetical protein
MADEKIIDAAPVIAKLAEKALQAKGRECSLLGEVIDMLRSEPEVKDAPYWATEAAYKNGYGDGKRDAVKHGRWEDIYGGKYANPRFRCSVCKEKANYKFVQDELLSWHDAQVLTPYCPYCMSKLDGGVVSDIKAVYAMVQR